MWGIWCQLRACDGAPVTFPLGFEERAASMTTANETVFQNFIAGQWRDSVSGQTFASTNPARESEVVGIFQRSTPEDLDAAIHAAQAALPAWRAVPAPERGEIVLRAALLLEQRREEYAKLLTREMGKILREARGDLQTAIDFGKFVAAQGRQAEGAAVPSSIRSKLCLTLREPMGVVGIITPWNFPIAIPAWKTFPALVAGNTVVLKPASDTPLLALTLVEVLIEAGLPPGVLEFRHRSWWHAGRRVGERSTHRHDLADRFYGGGSACG